MQYNICIIIKSFHADALQVLLIGGNDFTLVGKPLLRYDANIILV